MKISEARESEGMFNRLDDIPSPPLTAVNEVVSYVKTQCKNGHVAMIQLPLRTSRVFSTSEYFTPEHMRKRQQ